jgi:ubiquinone/menaquinone biosynthesis C-methylase UbiE
MIDQNHKDKFEQVWDAGNYRLGSTAQRMVKTLLQYIPEGATINDYGSGTGRAEVEILKQHPAQKINMIDIAENALEAPAREILNRPDSPLTFTLADLTDLSAVPPAEWGICINVLMTVQPDKLDAILREIHRTCDNLIMEVYDFVDERLGQDMTTVKKDATEWLETLIKYWKKITYIQSPESKRRYIFICEKG